MDRGAWQATVHGVARVRHVRVINAINISGLPEWLPGKESACQCKRRRVPSMGHEDPLEKEMATHPSILAWKISWTVEPGRL